MSRTVFFSWQNDRPMREGRNLIANALEAAVSKIAEDTEVVSAVREGLKVDRDTKGVPGSPPIFTTILNKIDRAAVFVADLTFIGNRPDGRPTPNPNVLIEYGWALKSLRYHQMISVMNAAYGEPTRESMPFDLANFRFPITYNVPDAAPKSARDGEQNKLAKVLETALRDIFVSDEFKASLPKAQEPPLFIPKEPMFGRARFRPRGEPLGVYRHPILHLTGSGEVIPVFLTEGAAMWMRLMPLSNPSRTWLTQDLRQAATCLAILPLVSGRGSTGFVQGEDGCGYYPDGGDRETYAISYVFTTGEVWVIDAWLNRVSIIDLEESKFTKSLDECASFLERLGIPPPYRWIVGLEGVKNYYLATADYWRRLGPCMASVIEQDGVYNKGDNTAALLRPFFEKVFDQCGAKRPESA